MLKVVVSPAVLLHHCIELVMCLMLCRAKDWVQSMLTWVTELLNAGVAAGTPVALSGGHTAAIMLEGVYIKYNMTELAELVDNVSFTYWALAAQRVVSLTRRLIAMTGALIRYLCLIIWTVARAMRIAFVHRA